MDATEESFAYRCLPLSIANAHGWEVCCRGGFEAIWNGGEDAEDVQVFPVGDGPAKAEGHFGSGILTFYLRAVFRAEPGHNLWVTGPPNNFKDGIQGLSAVIEADWMPYHFTMNWMFTRPNHRIRFEKGEPYCFLFPVKRGLPESMEPALKLLRDDPEIEHYVEYAQRARLFRKHAKLIAKERGLGTKIANEKKLRFLQWYINGKMPDGSGVFEAHQKSLHLRPFQDLRNKE
jgi:hypothetical protein